MGDIDECAQKTKVLFDIDQLYLFPDFDIPENLRPLFMKRFYDVAVHLVTNCEIEAENIPYLAENLVSKRNVKTTSELLNLLVMEGHNLDISDDPFSLGFRGISFILGQNSHKLTVQTLQDIGALLRPFEKVQRYRAC